jgi:hypothetical protein
MNEGKLIFSQLMTHLPIKSFKRCVKKYRGNRKVKKFTCLDQFYCMAFAQLTFRSSLRDIEACLRAMHSKLYHMGIRGSVSRNTLANANNKRDWRIYADFAQMLIHTARKLYRHDKHDVDLDELIYALDSTTIDLCLSLFPWAEFRQGKGAIKIHTLLDIRGSIPSFINITKGKIHDVNILDQLIPEPGAFYLLDRAYLDFKRLYKFEVAKAFFVIRSKSNFKFRRLYSHPIDKSTGLKCDQTVVLTGFYQSQDYPDKLRRVRYVDADTQQKLTFLTNNFSLLALIITQLYKCRWKVELFFRWIKQHLKIESFFGTSENAVKTQIWIAISVYVLVAIVKKRLKLDISLYTFLQILSVTIFEKVPILQLVETDDYKTQNKQLCNQLYLFD